MNHLLQDNRVETLLNYLRNQLGGLYAEREVQSIISLLFDEFKAWKKTDLILNKQERLSESEILKFHFALKRLLLREPIQYVLGHAHFRGLTFHVSNNVLIPRPETEELVELILSQEAKNPIRVLDIGTGSGCIPISLSKVRPNWDVSALDVSSSALEEAKQNAAFHSCPVHFIQKDILHEIPEGKKYDVIVSNPPYVLESDKLEMSSTVIDFEPSLALFVDDQDPLLFYRRLLDILDQIMLPGGRVYFEFHENKGKEMLDLASNYSVSNSKVIQDLQGKDRFLTLTYTP